ncbi:hypothetical protein HanRHA438_Chr12g0560561 [Helianthus annuus]|nr:hypothetical protein HanRHA438_Chr12g0560561 [Helianthus annuus]
MLLFSGFDFLTFLLTLRCSPMLIFWLPDIIVCLRMTVQLAETICTLCIDGCSMFVFDYLGVQYYLGFFWSMMLC